MHIHTGVLGVIVCVDALGKSASLVCVFFLLFPQSALLPIIRLLQPEDSVTDETVGQHSDH